MKRLAELVEGRIRRIYGTAAVRPQIHVPVQGGGDLLEGPYFPNASAFAPRRTTSPIQQVQSINTGALPGQTPSTNPPVQSRRGLFLLLLAAFILAIAAITAILWLFKPTSLGEIYFDPRSFFATAVKNAGLQLDDRLLQRLKLPPEFVGRRLHLLSFTSFEGTLDDRDWWGLIQPGELPIPAFPSPRPFGPIEKPFIAVSGIKSKDYAPPNIPAIFGLATLTADRIQTIFPVSGAKKVYLRYNNRADTNPQPATTQNCGSFLSVLYRVDSGAWLDAMHICGSNKLDPDSDSFHEGFVIFNLPPAAKTLEVAFAFEIQDVAVPFHAGFLMDDLTLFAEY